MRVPHYHTHVGNVVSLPDSLFYRQRLKSFPKLPAPVTCSCFNSAGDLFGYACGYDWSKGSEYATPGTQGNILIHNVVAEEIRYNAMKPAPFITTYLFLTYSYDLF